MRIKFHLTSHLIVNNAIRPLLLGYSVQKLHMHLHFLVSFKYNFW
jgi:hypothetical protein